MKKLNKKNLKKASPTLLSCFGAVMVLYGAQGKL